eukprot:TRINITY_DN50_c0_g1_i2.p1 TRINITY_DN50_c0_g1~~TRINITY_DN50_c0_g1_i2.p1  ORF type:complete len:847 (-),score=293.16 TRINITY_DN50_c0_g1_i2:58-2529(-)
MATTEPAAKKQKTEEEKPKTAPAAAGNTEKEEDAPKATGVKVKDAIAFHVPDTTMNVMSSTNGKVLFPLSDGGIRHLFAGARASVGVKAGRYMFEAKIIETLNVAESSQQGGKKKKVFRVGFSTSSSPLLLGDGDESVYFESDGMYGAAKSKSRAGAKIGRDQTACVLLNLDDKSPHANTVSLFIDGIRRCRPQKLPESLVGKTLFPHITFRNMSIQVNMGPTPLKALPFTCRMVQGAAKDEAVTSEDKAPKGGKHEVLVPVGFPDEGTFDWLDSFIEKNPSYVELSDRKLQAWAASSGLSKPKQTGLASNDKPTFAYGLPSMDDMSLQRAVNSLAPIAPRNYIVMEVKSNLIASEREKVLKRFTSDKFKKVAHVVMGEPKEEYKKRVLNKILKDKQVKVDLNWRMKKSQQEQKKAAIKRQKEAAAKKKEAEEKRKQLLEEAKKKKAEAEGGEKKEEEEKKDEAEKKDETEKKEEEKKEEPKITEPPEEEFEDLGEEPPKAELTEEEQKLWFMPKGAMSDLSQAMLNNAYASFTIPEKEEGFDDVKYEWQPEKKAKEYLRKWVLETKLTTRIENLAPSAYFREKFGAWTKKYAEWQGKQKAFKAQPKKADSGSADAPADIFSVEDVNDVGGGKPLYADFAPEDWALCQLRAELHLLQDAFKKDVNDPDRVAIPENHIDFYYQRYFKKALNPKMFTLTEIADLIKLVKDTAVISEDSKALSSQLSEDVEGVDIFVKLTEESRKERQRRIDAGDETARLKFVPPVAASPAKPAATPAAKAGAAPAAKAGAAPAAKAGAAPVKPAPVGVQTPAAKGAGKGGKKGKK